jgi:MarR family transcriptional regulator, 2-MHQ and catechol-resistance regulon repressor
MGKDSILKEYSKKIQGLDTKLRKQHDDISVDNTYTFLRISEALDIFLTRGFKKNGLNRTQVIILHFLLANGGTTTPTQIKNTIFRSINAISKSMDSLDKMGLTKSKRSKKDRRERQVSLTLEGIKMLEEILPLRKELFSKATNCLKQGDPETFKLLLNKIENHLLNKIRKSPKSGQNKLYF